MLRIKIREHCVVTRTNKHTHAHTHTHTYMHKSKNPVSYRELNSQNCNFSVVPTFNTRHVPHTGTCRIKSGAIHQRDFHPGEIPRRFSRSEPDIYRSRRGTPGIALIREIPVTMVTATRGVNLKVNYTGIRAWPASRRISGPGGTKRAKC